MTHTPARRWLLAGSALFVCGVLAFFLINSGLFSTADTGDKGKDPPAGKEGEKTEGPTMFGGSASRNMVNTKDKSVPLDFQIVNEDGEKALKNVKWSAQLGSKAYGGPVIVGGKIYVGTNNATPRDPKKKKDNLAVLQCYDAATGAFHWQIGHPMPAGEIFKDVTVPRLGLLSTPCVDGDMLFYVTPGCEVIGASTKGEVKWSFDMMKKLGVIPFHCSNCSPMVVDDLVYIVTGNGIDEPNEKVAAPKAPSFIALNKKDGTLAWQSNLPGENIIEGQWSNPTLAVVDGKKQIIFPGGDGVIYSLDPLKGTLIWKFNCHPDGAKKVAGEPLPAYFVATPVAHEGKVYIGMGVYPEHAGAPRSSYFFCIDASKKGDVSPKSLDHKDPKNKASALVWAYGGPINPRPKMGRSVNFGVTISTAAIHDGLIFIAEESGYIHCLDQKTGERQWVYDFKTQIWGSPYVVAGKVLIGVEEGVLHVLNAERKMKILVTDKETKKRSFVDEWDRDKQDLGINFGETLHSTPVMVDGTLYVMTSRDLFAIPSKK